PHQRFFVVEDAENGGVDGGGIDQGLVALDVHDDVGVGCGGDFGDTVGSGGMVGARHSHTGLEIGGGGEGSFVVGGDDDVRQVARLRGSLPHVLQHGFTGNRDEGFTRKTRGCVPCGDYSKNPVRHNRI